MRSLALIILLAAFSAKACPDLAGEYNKCSSKTGFYLFSKFEASQTKVKGETLYKMAATDAETKEKQAPLLFNSNGEEMVMGEVFDDVIMHSTSSCVDNTLKTVISFNYGQEGYLNLDITKKGRQLTLRYYSEFGEEDVVVCE